MGKTVILSGVRTPFGKFGGALKPLTAAQLGGIAVKEALHRARVSGEQVDQVILGTVLQGGQGQLPSRQAMRYAGIPWEVRTETVNKVCASGMRSVTLGDQIIRLGDAEVIVAGGMESMSNAPYILPNARWGLRMGDAAVKDLMVYDGLTCSFTGVHMGVYGGETAKELEISREEQDEWAYRSHQRAIAAMEAGLLAEEIVPVEVPQHKGEPLLVEHDEAPRKDTSLEKLAKLPPVFDPEGTITAGNAPGVNDGAAALVLMSEERAAREGRKPLATILAHASIAVAAKDFPKTPGFVINELLRKTGKTVDDIDLFEINEAFAAVALASIKIAGIDPEKVNVNGGAVALGHPIGASGARIIITLIHELKRRGGGIGIAAICSGGGQGDAVMVQVDS
ncbi:acetyl-CoA C-acetyltransferase [Parageobacillus thermoglucosidasius]|uniref:acetyl-CoA C-acetyltransferase n=2 Tax=Anoxybacillaceae TaxID=3120669 RepID=A0AAN1D5R4_PARTM|nr:acetyl-CoA C-acetyltransferase [Parageobacillus thermoglucosidasius]ALF09180.1 acetyl-CoA acetyltransferase [Parageobacillus thermoglucosidasius]ANZ29262.1 acetyl-CoA acetyltransferase [Parageobacillus thermoglucosidasius]APM80000.1 acetyl-CoA acetyltransferase [Parageobacillus thermoglucosidasius]KJX69988.1 acetyl-CoA acetyltransferase [Parageobacillus thermoglucosidasius]MBY6266713.1 acetyl-CoA C-acyltransferase [Parageobacillus thermoglucosidasius]